MENINFCLTIPNDLSLTIKLKNFYSVSTHNVPVSGTKCRVSRSVWGTGHSLIQQPPEMTGTCSALFESRGHFSSETRIKCTRKSLSFDSGKESSFQLCYSPFRNEKGILLEKKFHAIVSGIVTGVAAVRYCQFFSLSLVTIPEVFAKAIGQSFLCCFK